LGAVLLHYGNLDLVLSLFGIPYWSDGPTYISGVVIRIHKVVCLSSSDDYKSGLLEGWQGQAALPQSLRMKGQKVGYDDCKQVTDV
jgi:hypothetical protein